MNREVFVNIKVKLPKECDVGFSDNDLEEIRNYYEKEFSNFDYLDAEFEVSFVDERDILAKAFKSACQFFISEKLDGSDQYTVEQAVKEYKYYINLFYKQAVSEIKKVKEDV